MKHYLVVGGTKGIGLVVTNALIKQGHHVTVWARQAVEIEGAQFQEQNILNEIINIDTLPEVIDGVVYCPGSINLKPFGRLSEADFLLDWQINFLGAVKVLQAVHPLLKKSEHPSVVLFSTVAVAMGMPFHSSIAGAKGAVEGLVKSLAAEWAPLIRVNAIAPSITNTPLAQKILSSPEKIDAAAKRHPLQKVGAATDIASATEFLLSPASSWITGQILHVDGGLSSLKI